MGLKLGDSIIQINDQDTTDMALQEAQKLIEISSNQLQLKVKKYLRPPCLSRTKNYIFLAFFSIDDEEETGHAEVRNILLRTENSNKTKSVSKDGSPHPNMPGKQQIDQDISPVLQQTNNSPQSPSGFRNPNEKPGIRLCGNNSPKPSPILNTTTCT